MCCCCCGGGGGGGGGGGVVSTWKSTTSTTQRTDTRSSTSGDVVSAVRVARFSVGGGGDGDCGVDDGIDGHQLFDKKDPYAIPHMRDVSCLLCVARFGVVAVNGVFVVVVVTGVGGGVVAVAWAVFVVRGY